MLQQFNRDPKPISPSKALDFVAATESDLDNEYQTNYKKHLAYARLLTPSLSSAEDLVHQAFLNVLKQIKSSKKIDAATLAGYITTCIRNNSISIYRKSSKDSGLYIVKEDQASPEQLFQLSDEKKLVSQALDKLPKVQRTVIIMYYFDGLNSNQISKAIGISNSAVKTHLQRARKSLSVHISNSSKEEEVAK